MTKAESIAKPKDFVILQNKARKEFPQLTLWIGKPKIGKSTAMAQLPKSLIISTDPKGYSELDVDALVIAKNLTEVFSAVRFFFSNDAYDNLVIDELRGLSEMYAKKIKGTNEVTYLSDIGWQKGFRDLKEDLYALLYLLQLRLEEAPDKRIFLVAHADDRNAEIRLDVNGKNESMILSMVDTIGLIDRDIENNTIVNFKARPGVEYGSRNNGLSKYKGVLDWKTLFEVAKE